MSIKLQNLVVVLIVLAGTYFVHRYLASEGSGGKRDSPSRESVTPIHAPSDESSPPARATSATPQPVASTYVAQPVVATPATQPAAVAPVPQPVAAPAALQPVAVPELRIVRATFGTKEAVADVTGKVRAAINGNFLVIRADANSLGIHWRWTGPIKELRVLYSFGCREFLSITREGNTAAIPGAEDIPLADLSALPSTIPSTLATVAPPTLPTSGGRAVVARPERRQANPTEPPADVGNLKALKPEDLVLFLPADAQRKYFEIRASLRGNERIEALRSWLSIWKSSLQEPYLTLVELEYVKAVIENRGLLKFERVSYQMNSRDRHKMEASMRLRLTVLDSLDNLIRAIRTRGVRHDEILQMIGEYTESIADERVKLLDALSGR